MAEDVRALLDHLEIERADLMGYSMGSRIAAFLSVRHPARVRSAILGGLGIRLVEGVGLPESIAEALEAPIARRCERSDRPHVPRFRRADEVRPARARRLYPRLAADFKPRERWPQSWPRYWLPSARTTRWQAVPQELAALIPGARALDIPGRDHMLAVGDKVFKTAVIDFLNQRA